MRCLVFPGQGIQRRGMGRGLFERFPDLVEAVDAVLGYSIVDLCLTNGGGRLRDTTYAQPAIFVVNALAALAHLEDTGARYDHYAGHSLGEYNALVAAGHLDLVATVDLVRERATAMAEITGGGMAAVSGLPSDVVEHVVRMARLPQVYVANRNSDRQTVIAGDRPQVTTAVDVLTRAGAHRASMLNVSGPFHTPLMTPAVERFEKCLADLCPAPSGSRVVSSVTGQVVEPHQIADLLARQIDSPVEWVATVTGLRQAGVTRFDEVNGTTLTGLIRDIH